MAKQKKELTDATKTPEPIVELTPEEVLEEKRKTAETALLAGKAKDYADAKVDLDKAAEEYNTLLRYAQYDKFVESGNPFVAFASAVFYTGKRVKETRNKETKALEGVVVEDEKYRLKLREFIEYKKLDTSMLRDISDLLTVLTVREKEIVKLSHEDFVTKSRFFCDIVREKEAGGTPDSNTQICRRIQGIMDKAGIECRVTNLDMHFIQQCSFVHNGKGIAQIKSVTAGKFLSVVVDVMAHFVKKIPYSVLEKEQKKSA